MIVSALELLLQKTCHYNGIMIDRAYREIVGTVFPRAVITHNNFEYMYLVIIAIGILFSFSN